MTTVSDLTTVRYSGDPRADALLQQMPDWNFLLPERTTLYYTFDLGVIGPETAAAVTAFNAAQMAATVQILNYIASICGISFAQAASGASADLHFGACDLAGASVTGQTAWRESWSAWPNGTVASYTAEAFIYLDNAEFFATTASPTAGSNGYQVLLHEIGHALGLGHPFEGPYTLPAGQDNTDYTVMSYTWVGPHKSTFQTFDLLALRWIYGDDGLRGNHGLNSVYGPSLTGGDGDGDGDGGGGGGSGSGGGGGVDATAPTVVSFTPADEAVNVAVQGNVVLIFSEAIQRGTGNITLRRLDGSVVETFAAASSTRLTIADNTLTIDPVADLAHGTAYKVEIATGAIRDPAGNPYTGTTAYNFSTAAAPDTTPPTLQIASNKANLSAGETATISFTLSEASSNFAASDVSVTGGSLSGFSGSSASYTAVFTPASNSTVQAVISVGSGRFSDAAGNANVDGADVDNSVRIVVDTQMPTVLSFVPADGATGVAISTSIVLHFSEAVQRGTGQLTLKTGAGATVETLDAATSARLVFTGATLTIDPSLDLVAGAQYRLDVAPAAVRDLAGNGYAGTTSYNFVAGRNVVTGTARADTLVGTGGADTLRGLDGNDTLTGREGDDILDGGLGMDRVLYGFGRADATIAKTLAGHAVTSALEGRDTLFAVERLQFSDISVALDVGAHQSAGRTALLLGAALPGSLVFDASKQALLGAVIDLFDTGYTLRELSGALLRLPVWDVLTGQAAPGNRDIASYLLANVNGQMPDQLTLDAAVNALDTEPFQGDWLAGLAGSAANQSRIGLVGLIDTGVEFLPLQP